MGAPVCGTCGQALPGAPSLPAKALDGPWTVIALSRHEAAVRGALEAMSGIGGNPAQQPENSTGLWRASVACQGIKRAERLALEAMTAGAAAMCRPC
jgi:hypothetical protein